MSLKLRYLLLFTVIPFAIGNGQSTWSFPDDDNVFDLRISRGFFSDGNPGLATFTATPSIRIGVSPKVAIEGELPVAFANADDPFDGESISGSRIGNPYFGVSAGVAPSVRIRVGFRYGMGISDNDDDGGGLLALAYGVISEFDRWEAYVPEANSARVLAEIGTIPTQGAFVQARLGATRVMQDDLDGETLVEYGVRVGHTSSGVLLSAGLLGRYWLDGDGGDRNTNQVALGVAAASGAVRPMVEVRSFIDEDLREGVKAVLSLGIAVQI